MRERGRKTLANACLYKLTKNRNAGYTCSQSKMRKTDCPAIVQPDLLTSLPNE